MSDKLLDKLLEPPTAIEMAELLDACKQLVPSMSEVLRRLMIQYDLIREDHLAMQKLRDMLAAAHPEDTIELVGHNDSIEEWVLHWWDSCINGYVFTNGDDPVTAILQGGKT